jgi:hypothetical protein
MKTLDELVARLDTVASLLELCAKGMTDDRLDAVLESDGRILAALDVMRQSTLGLLIEEVRVLDGRVMAIGNTLGDIVGALTKHKKPRPKRRKGHS